MNTLETSRACALQWVSMNVLAVAAFAAPGLAYAQTAPAPDSLEAAMAKIDALTQRLAAMEAKLGAGGRYAGTGR